MVDGGRDLGGLQFGGGRPVFRFGSRCWRGAGRNRRCADQRMSKSRTRAGFRATIMYRCAVASDASIALSAFDAGICSLSGFYFA